MVSFLALPAHLAWVWRSPPFSDICRTWLVAREEFLHLDAENILQQTLRRAGFDPTKLNDVYLASTPYQRKALAFFAQLDRTSRTRRSLRMSIPLKPVRYRLLQTNGSRAEDCLV